MQARLLAFVALSFAATTWATAISKPSKLARSKVLSLRGGEVEFKNFGALEKADLILGAMYATQCLALPQFFNEQTYGEADSSATSKANLHELWHGDPCSSLRPRSF